MIFEVSRDLFVPAYWPLLEDDDADMHFLWGGRDSGKSHFIAQKLVLKCLNDSYFRCILVKKTYESIKDSQFKMIKDVVMEWGLQDHFTFTEAPLTITCDNGNTFIARGCDKAEKMKSITNPSCAWYEEADQLSQEDQETISSTLRTSNAKVQEWLSFNPEGHKGSFQEHWIDVIYTHRCSYNKHETHSISIPAEIDGEKIEIPIKFTSTHTTYRDNPYASLKRIARHELLKETNHARWVVWSLGHRGVKDVERPYCYNFLRDKHVRPVEKKSNLPIRLMFDFNLEPLVCLFSQMWTDTKGHHWHIFDMLALSPGDIPTLCEKIKSKLTPAELSNVIVTGDATGRQRQVILKNNIDAWRTIQKALRISEPRMQIPSVNPSVKENQHLCNSILALHPDFSIDPCCDLLIAELMYTEADSDGNIKKRDRSKEEQRADALDCFRYGCNSWLPDFGERPERYMSRS